MHVHVHTFEYRSTFTFAARAEEKSLQGYINTVNGTVLYLTCLQMCMQLPLLPRHPSVYISPVICPVETALILSAQTPFSF